MFNPPVEAGEVLIYVDYCDECFSNHRIEHHPDGTTRHELNVMKDPAYYNAGHHAGVITYRIRYSAPLSVQLPTAPAWFEQYADRADAMAEMKAGQDE